MVVQQKQTDKNNMDDNFEVDIPISVINHLMYVAITNACCGPVCMAIAADIMSINSHFVFFLYSIILVT